MKKRLFTLVLIIILVLLNSTLSLAIETVQLEGEQYLVEDYQRFQQLSSPKVAVSLSGGGARALANIGVIKALVEENIPIDIITGSSMGSIIGSMYGSGLSIQQIEDIITKNPFAQLFSLNFTSNESLLKTYQANQFIGRILPHKKLENFPIPTALLSYDLTTANKYITTTGELSHVIQGSYSIPYYFPPYNNNDHYLIDSGMLEMSPAKTAKVLGADFIIATTAFNQLPYTEYNTPARSAGRFVTLMQEENTRKILNQYADIVIETDVSNYSFIDFERAQGLVELGYETTMEQIKVIKEELKTKKIKLKQQKPRDRIDLTEELSLLKNDRLLSDDLLFTPIIYKGKTSSFLTHNLLTTYTDNLEYGLELEQKHLDLKLLTNNNQNQEINSQLRWKQLSPKTDWLLKMESNIDNNTINFKTEIKYYQLSNNHSLGIGEINNKSFFYTASQYQFGPSKEKTTGEIELVYSEENKLTTIFSQRSTYNLNKSWQLRPKLSFNNTDFIPTPLIYRGINPQEESRIQTGVDLVYNHNLIKSIELMILQLTDIRAYAFVDYQDNSNSSYAYGIGNRLNFNLLGLKPINIESYIAYDNQTQDLKSLIKLDYQF